VSGSQGVLGRAASVALWYVLPALALAAVAAYILGATIGHANPPVVPVEGVSMRPALQAGDLIVLTGVDPARLRTGDIVAVTVPKSARDQYSLPAHVVHRIVRIEHTRAGLVFITKGDANSGPDVFQSRSGDIVGKLRLDLPGLGYPLLFFRSRQGEIFLAAAALVALVYFLLGLFEERRAYVEGSVLTMQTLLEETQQLKLAIASAERLGRVAAAPQASDRLADEVRASSDRSTEVQHVMDRLVGAVGEYGEHLRSHTAVMENLAATTAELSAATAALRSTLRPAEDSGAVAAEAGGSGAPFVPGGALPREADVDRLLEQTAAQLEDATRRRLELRRKLGSEWT
jgi:signal peptidase I